MEISNRKKEVALTIFSNLSLQVITAICGFVLPPLIISVFGSSVNGMVASISQFIAYLNLVEAGVGGASIAALYKPLAENDSDKRNEILSATSSFYNKSGFLFTILIFVLVFAYPLIVGNEVDKIQSGLMVLVLGITGSAEFFLIGKYRVLLTADKKTYVISFVQMFAVILNTVIAVVLIKLDFSILIVKLASSLIYLSRYFLILFYIKRKYSDLDFKTTPDKKAISQSKNVLVHQIGGLVVFNSPIVIITIFCSLKDASVYAIYSLVFNGVGSLLGSFSNGLQSFFGESFAKEDLEITRKFYSKFETLFFAVEGWFYSLTYILIMPFMNLYTKNMTDADYIQPNVALLFVIVGVLNYLRQPGGILINALGHFKKTQYQSILESLINVVCSIVFTIKFGFIGVLIGAICSYLYRTFDIIIYSSKRILNTTFIKSTFKIFIFLIFYVFLIYVVKLIRYEIFNYFQWILYSLVIAFIFSIPFFILFFKWLRVEKKIK